MSRQQKEREKNRIILCLLQESGSPTHQVRPPGSLVAETHHKNKDKDTLQRQRQRQRHIKKTKTHYKDKDTLSTWQSGGDDDGTKVLDQNW